MPEFRIKVKECFNGRKIYSAQVRLVKYFLFIPYYHWYFIDHCYQASDFRYEYEKYSLEEAESLITKYIEKVDNIRGWEIKAINYKNIKPQDNA